MKRIIIFCFIFCAFNLVNAQESEMLPKHAISMELGKTGLIWHFNYDRFFMEKDYGLRVDVGSNLGQYLLFFVTGLGGYKLYGGKKKYFELGADVNYLHVEKSAYDDVFSFGHLVYPDFTCDALYLNLNLGYRVYGFGDVFRIGISPGYAVGEFLPGGYISYGRTF